MPTCGMFSQATTFDLVLPAHPRGRGHGQPRDRRPRPRRTPLARDGLPLSAVPRQRRARRARVSPAPPAGALQRRHPGALAAAALPRGAAGCDRGGRGRQSALRRSRADDDARQRRSDHRRPLRRRLVRDLHGVGRRGRRIWSRASRPPRRTKLTSEDVLTISQTDVRPTRMRCVTLPLTVLQQALQP